MAMYACKNIGCAINYCGTVKMSTPSLWEGSSDCQQEIKDFNKCMVDEQRRWNWMDKSQRPPMYDYVQQRIKEKALEQKYNLLSEEESSLLKQEIKEKFEAVKTEPVAKESEQTA